MIVILMWNRIVWDLHIRVSIIIFLQKNGNISGIEKDGEPIVYYSYGSDRFKDEVTGVFSKNESV